MGRVRAVPRLWKLYTGICLTAEEKARKNLILVPFLPRALWSLFHKVDSDWNMLVNKYEGWNFNSGNYLFTTDTK